MNNERFIFRGKQKNSEWVFGGLVFNDGIPFILRLDANMGTVLFAVDPESLGQCAGLNDKKRKLIFEVDIVNDHCCHSWQNNTGIIQWSSRKSCLCIKWISGRDDLKNHEVMLFEWLNLHDETKVNVEIIGNIHENPEMVK